MKPRSPAIPPRSRCYAQPLDGADVLPSPPGALAAADVRWRTFAPRVAFAVLTDCTAATLGTD